MTDAAARTKVTIRPGATRLRVRYLTRKRFALVAIASWLYGILLLGIANAFSIGLGATLIVATLAASSVLVAALWSWKKEKLAWSVATGCSQSATCGQLECESPGQGCGAKLAQESERLALEAELRRLRLLLRFRFGPDLLFFAMWIAIAGAFFFSSLEASVRIAATFLGVASLLVIVARLALSSFIFGAKLFPKRRFEL